ncbi:nucleotidyltransferase family protein [Dictyobacter kobayashii]|uniref:Nucleoside-diphosphate-sugar pyrophosphorylase n=1 Tax=Dictyobacter kobayashii TaxID=2014872 RepID=A0A402ASJ1_9CHLR|nr:sugar phosphate nucleotidyltransferase [Dictyobacter kobayashii]GCE22070.1 nucleoside-diphosphate-sugar pyrophosphorylase [Dictyobacter kobayashii]
MRAILLAGGKGMRLQPYTKVFPKSLIPLDDLPILQIILQQLRDAGFTSCVLAVSHKANQIERYFGDGSWLGIEIEYSYSSIPLGTAGPLRMIDVSDEPCLVMNSDVLTSLDFADVYASHLDSGAMASVVLCPHEVSIGLGLVEINEKDDSVTGYTEKPTFSYLVSSGIYVLNPGVIDYIPQGEFIGMPTLFQRLLADNKHIHSYQFHGEWFDIGTIEQYMKAEEAFQRYRDHFLRSEYAQQSELDRASKKMSPLANLVSANF